ncbi:hypothetical protein B0H16DRAFT_1894448 [Mycena metata]|uniref:Uncharacterized protein n=1 Tax=Mycena metata TaxID=1033252 RepID=A0AAD7MPU3_9AGAR|nr:hypothetical protein B0H16DRAFT_1894448 [Mycena metata]
MDTLPPLVQPLVIDGIKLVVLGGTVETARRVSSPAWNHFINYVRTRLPFRIPPIYHPITSFRSYTSAFPFRFANTRAVFPYHPFARRLARFFPYIFSPPFAFLLVHIPRTPSRATVTLPSRAATSHHHPNSLRPPSRAHSPRLPLPTCHIHPVSLLAHTLPPYSVPVLPFLCVPPSTSPSRAHTRAALPLSFPPLLSHTHPSFLPPPPSSSSSTLPSPSALSNFSIPHSNAPANSKSPAHAHASAASSWEDDPVLNELGGAGGEGEGEEGHYIVCVGIRSSGSTRVVDVGAETARVVVVRTAYRRSVVRVCLVELTPFPSFSPWLLLSSSGNGGDVRCCLRVLRDAANVRSHRGSGGGRLSAARGVRASAGSARVGRGARFVVRVRARSRYFSFLSPSSLPLPILPHRLILTLLPPLLLFLHPINTSFRAAP